MIGYFASVKRRAARSIPSPTEAGLPSIRQAGPSSCWWLKNHDLPRMHAALASVIRSPSTFSVMSSQRQPQNVQVASSTILISAFVSSGLTVLIAGASPWAESPSILSFDLLQHHV